MHDMLSMPHAPKTLVSCHCFQERVNAGEAGGGKVHFLSSRS